MYDGSDMDLYGNGDGVESFINASILLEILAICIHYAKQGQESHCKEKYYIFFSRGLISSDIHFLILILV